MPRKSILTLLLIFVLVVAAVPAVAQDDEFVFGVILVGPKNDRGWSQANFEAGQYVEEKIPGARMVVFESLNVSDAPETTLEDVVSEMVDGEGAQLIFTTSDDFEEDTTLVAAKFPDIPFVNVAGDDAYTGEASSNLSNLMGEMEWGKEIAGCAAALATETGSIGYVGPLINFETRRLVSSVYLGARYCYENYAGGNPEDLKFSVTWIGFWFNIPGFTLDPTEETKTLFDNGADVVISGIDTTESMVVAAQRAAEGEKVWAIPYDYAGSCEEAPDICLGVPYFNWGPAYVNIVESVMDGTWEQTWEWNGPDWEDINNPDTTAVGYIKGEGLSEEAEAALDAFIAEMAEFASDPANADTMFLWEGPLALQDGTVIAEEGVALPKIAPLGETPSIWYLEQLLEGMIGASNP